MNRFAGGPRDMGANRPVPGGRRLLAASLRPTRLGRAALALAEHDRLRQRMREAAALIDLDV